jgi:lysophospholipase L1-like esterase
VTDLVVTVDSVTKLPPTSVLEAIAGSAELNAASAAEDKAKADRADQAWKALAVFRRAVARRDTAAVNVWCIGDSITLGLSPVSPTTRWASVLRDALRRDNPTAGDPVGGFGFLSASSAQSSAVVTTGGLAMAQGSTAFSPDSYTWRAYSPGDQQVYTFTGTGADIIYWKLPSTAGSGFKWSVDGGSTTTVVTDGTYVGPERVQITGLTAGVHTVKVEWAVGSSPGTMYSGIAGLVVYNGDEAKGFRVLAGGISGGTTATWDSMASGPFEIAKLYAPDLVIIALGTNDYGGTFPVSAATYKANLLSMIAKIKARTTGKIPSFVLSFPSEIYEATPLSPFADYRAAVYEIADADPDHVTVFDWGSRFNPVPTFGSTLGGIMHTDYVHPTAAGHAYIASMLARFLPTAQAT